MHLLHLPYIVYNEYLTVWGVEPLVTHQTSWLERTGVKTASTLIWKELRHLSNVVTLNVPRRFKI